MADLRDNDEGGVMVNERLAPGTVVIGPFFSDGSKGVGIVRARGRRRGDGVSGAVSSDRRWLMDGRSRIVDDRGRK